MSGTLLPILPTEAPLGCVSVLHLVGKEGADRCKARGIAGHGGPMRAPFGVIGLNHRTASLELRSLVGVAGDATEPFLARALQLGLAECVVLSTCNRTEIYFVGGSRDQVVGLLAERAGIAAEELRAHLYEKSCVCAACHLFRVTSGLDSAVLGETEIVAQVKDAWRMAVEAGASGRMLDLLFQRSLEASKRIRTETDLCRSVTSTGSLAVRQAESALGDLATPRVVLLGAGKIAERILKDLRAAEAGNVHIVNRTEARARELASAHGGEVVLMADLEAELIQADAVFATIGADSPILTKGLLQRVSDARHGRRLLIIDMGVPPNVETAVSIPGIEVVGLERLVEACTANAELRASAIPAAFEILDEELDRLASAVTERAAAPTIQALVAHGNAIRQRNLDWAKERLGDLNDKEMRVVEEMARRMMIGLLQTPIDSLKTELAAKEHREVVERLFALHGGPSDS